MLAIADLNRDGRPDVAMARYYDMDSDDVSVLLQAADGSFGPSLPQYPTGAGATSVVLGDLNGDGKLDVVTANAASLSVLLGRGGGSFGAKTDYPVGGAPRVLLLGDLNGDGNLDIVTNVAVLFGKGDGTFTVKPDDGTGIGTDWSALGDFNGDGKLDVVTANYVETTTNGGIGTVSVRLGNGDGSFGAKTDFEAGVMPDGVAVGDVNGDGKLDLAVANSGLDGAWSLSVLLGKGDGSFGAAEELPIGGEPQLDRARRSQR